MLTIYKYPLAVNDHVAVALPKGALPLCVQVQGERPCLWAKVDTEQETEQRVFRVTGTGHPLDPDAALLYVDTFQMFNGGLVFHVFEVADA
jgi:hypothetical protein